MNEGLDFDKTVITLKSIGLNGFDIVEKPNQLLDNPLPGKPCPKCKDGVLDYDGLLNLICIKCGYTLVGCST